MSRNFIPCLGLALGAAMIAGAPATADGSVTTAVLQSNQAPTASTAPAGPADPASLAARVEATLKGSPDLAGADIKVRSDEARIVLEGTTTSELQRQAAERLAGAVMGVSSVDNRITVAGPPEGTKGSVLAGDVKDTARVAGDKTEAALEKTGSAIGRAAEATKDAVVAGAKKTRDVVAATPEKIDETWITSKIAGKINADDALEHVDVDVKVDKNVVTITGDVPSTALRDRVLRIARETEGVTRVVDRMTIRRTPDRRP